MEGLVLPKNLFIGNKFKEKLELQKFKIKSKTAFDFAMKFFSAKKDKLSKIFLPVFLSFLKLYLKLTKDKNLENIEEKDDNKKNDPQDKKKDKEDSIIRKAYLKLFKNKFFTTLLGSVKKIASASFISELLTFLILLKYGVFNFFIPVLLSTLQDALLTLVNYIPTIIKFIIDLLIKTIPELLKPVLKDLTIGIITEILQLLGFQQKEIKDILGKLNKVLEPVINILSNILPSLLVILYFFPKIISIITGTFSFLKTIFSTLFFLGKILLFIGKILVIVGKILFTIFSSTAGIVVLIIAAIVGIGYLIYKYWDVIKEKFIKFGKFIAQVFNKYIITPIGKIIITFKKLFKSILNLFNKYIIEPIKKVADTFFNFFISPLKGIMDSFSKIKAGAIDKISSIFDWLSSGVKDLGNLFKSFIKSVTSIIQEVIGYLSLISDIGILDWGSLKSSERATILQRRKQIVENDIYYKKLMGLSLTAQQEKQIDKNKLAEYQKLFNLANERNIDFANLLASAISKDLVENLDGIKVNTDMQVILNTQLPEYITFSQQVAK